MARRKDSAAHNLTASVSLVMLFLISFACGLRWIDRHYAVPAAASEMPAPEFQETEGASFGGFVRATLGIPTAHAAPAGRLWAGTRTGGPTLVEVETGSTKDIVFTYRNAGTKTWKNSGRGYVSIYATLPRAASRPTVVLREASVAPGKVGTFAFRYVVPDAPGTYNYRYQLASENVAWLYGTGVNLTVRVVQARVTKSTPVNAGSYIVVDAANGEVLMERNADEQRSIASLTKLMTVMTAKRIGIDSEAIIAMESGDEVGGGRLRMPYGSKLTVRNLIAAALVGSANNSANAVARATGLPRAEFVARMNATASALGLMRTSFADPTGIEVENFSTAREFAKLARTAFADPEVAAMTSSPVYPVVSMSFAEPRQIQNTNQLVHDAGVSVLAGKTGFIYEAGYTLATELRKENERDLLVVVLGSDTKDQSFRDAKILAEQAWLD